MTIEQTARVVGCKTEDLDRMLSANNHEYLLPVSFLHALALASGSSMGKINLAVQAVKKELAVRGILMRKKAGHVKPAHINRDALETIIVSTLTNRLGNTGSNQTGTALSLAPSDSYWNAILRKNG